MFQNIRKKKERYRKTERKREMTEKRGQNERERQRERVKGWSQKYMERERSIKSTLQNLFNFLQNIILRKDRQLVKERERERERERLREKKR